MRNTNKIITFSVFMLVALFGMLLVAKDNKEEENNALTDQLKADSFNFNQILQITDEQLESENTFVTDSILFLTEKGNYEPLGNLMKGTDKFIIRFNDSGCTSCVEYFLKNINDIIQLSNDVKEENIMVVLNTKKPRDILLFKNKLKIPYEVYGVPLGDIPLEIEIQNEVVAYYYFILTNKMTSNDVFIPIQELSERTDLYFKSIKKHFNLLQ